MRGILLLVATMALTLLVASGVALAVTKIGTAGPDTLMGTKGSDKLVGRGKSDWIDGRAGNDLISGGPGDDDPLSPALGNLIGGSGADIISGGSGGDLMYDSGDSAVTSFTAVRATTSSSPHPTVRPHATSSVVVLVNTTARQSTARTSWQTTARGYGYPSLCHHLEVVVNCEQQG